jgi:hypothetical protein
MGAGNKFGIFSGMRVEKRYKKRRRWEVECRKGRGTGWRDRTKQKVYSHSGMDVLCTVFPSALYDI